MTDDLTSIPEQPWPKKGDKLVVERGENWHYNAWLPSQNSLHAHIEGYERAAEILWNELDGRPREAGIDYLVYPFVFLCRHFVELNLKEIIRTGNRLEGNSEKFPAHHRLEQLWGDAKKLITRIEGQPLAEDIAAMSTLIDELAKVDPISMAFRYPTAKDGSPSIPGREWINLAVFQDGMEKMKAFFYGVRCQFDYYESNRP